MKLSEKGYQVLKHFEGCKLKAYKDVAGIWTIGYGNTYYADQKRVLQNHEISQQYAEELLQLIVRKFEDKVTALIHATISQTQFDACVCLAYNIGWQSFAGSSLLKKINDGDIDASERFLLWNKAKVNGELQVVKGLTNRRKSEKYLFDTGEVKFYN